MNLKNEVSFLEGLCRVLLSESDFTRASEVLNQLLSQYSEDTLFEVAQKHKVVVTLHQNLIFLLQRNLLNDKNELFRLSHVKYDEAMEHRSLIIEESLNLLSRITGTETSDNLILLKGLSLHTYYPSNYVRWMRDIDIMVKTPEDAMFIYTNMVKDGYSIDEYELPWLKRNDQITPSTYGQVVLRKYFGNDYSRFDIHYTCYSISYSGWLDVDLWANLKEIEYSGVKLKVLNAEVSLCLMLGHMLSQGYVSIKDINDFVAIIISATSVSWDYVVKIARRNQLIPQFSCLLAITENLYRDHPLLQETCRKIDSIFSTSEKDSSWRVHDRSWTLRADMNARFTYAFEKKHNHNLSIGSVLSALQCYIHYRRRLELVSRRVSLTERLLRLFTPTHDLKVDQINSKTCVVLVPLSLQFSSSVAKNIFIESNLLAIDSVTVVRYLANEIIYINFDDSEIILFPNHAFIPSFDLVVEENIVKRSEGQLQKLLQLTNIEE